MVSAGAAEALAAAVPRADSDTTQNDPGCVKQPGSFAYGPPFVRWYYKPRAPYFLLRYRHRNSAFIVPILLPVIILLRSVTFVRNFN